MKLVLRIWRQASSARRGGFERYELDGLQASLSLLEALDVLNRRLLRSGQSPVAFESDCREGICGACGVVVSGLPHGGRARTATCELRVADFDDGAELTLEPFRARPFVVLRDLIVDRSALDRVMQAGGYVTLRTGSAPEANVIPIGKEAAERALDAAACIGCGACVAACPNAAAALFVGAKLAHLGALPQGAVERSTRAHALVHAADAEGFGACTLHGECHAACPKGIPLEVIMEMNRDFLRAR